MKNIHVPYGATVHGDEEIEAVVEVLKTSTQMGKNVRQFEERIASLFDKQFGVMVNSGSSALYLAVECLDIEEGSQVITPALTFATTVGCLVKNKLVPSFIDVREGTYCADIDQIEDAISAKTRAISIPNLIGNVPDWHRIYELADRYGLLVIEDSADTLDARIDSRSTGYGSDVSITSFYGSHVINGAGNGGMLCVNSEEIATKARLLRSWGRSSSLFANSESIENRFNVELDNIPYDNKFVFEAIGYQMEPSEISAAFALVQLSKLDENINKRVNFFDKQRAFFKTYEEWFVLPEQLPNVRTGWLAFPLTIRDAAPFNRRHLQTYLEERNIQTRVVFTGNILRQPGFSNIECVTRAAGYPESDKVMKGGILLACHHGLDDEKLAYVHEVTTDFLRNYSR